MHKLQPQTERLIEQTNRFREPQLGICADPAATRRPEDAIHAEVLRKGGFSFSGSIVEVGLLDRNGDTVRSIINDLVAGKNPGVWLPTDRKIFCYAQDRPMPSLTVRGTFRPDIGLSDLDLVRTKVHPRHYAIEESAIHSEPMFRPIAAFTHAFKKHDLTQKCRNPKKAKLEPHVAVAAFSNAVNLSVAQLTREAKLPQLLHAYPETITLEDGTELTDVVVTPEPRGHSLFQGREYAAATSPARTTRDWFNQVALSHFMDTGESVFDYQEAHLISGWFNHRKRKRLERIVAQTKSTTQGPKQVA